MPQLAVSNVALGRQAINNNYSILIYSYNEAHRLLLYLPFWRFLKTGDPWRSESHAYFNPKFNNLDNLGVA